MRLTDFHTHAFPDALAPVAVAQLARQGGIPYHYDGTVAGLLGAMARAGVDRAVVAPVATKPSQVRTINDWVTSLDDPRLVPFGAMHPDFEDPGAEIARATALGIRGLKMHGEYQAFAPDDPRMVPIYAAAERHGLIMLFHAGADVGPQTVRGTPEAFARMLDAHPTLTVVLAHMGGFRQWAGVREHLLGRSVYLDTAYTLGHLPDEEFVALVRDHGVDRVLFGSDGPWTDAAVELERLRAMPFSASELAAICGGNAARLLG
ncbi:MAG: amidohydrolase family protein [Anaerosomatales bacterium]|nr:amidohydrolase family protein [Anaerosomatales bacterium]